MKSGHAELTDRGSRFVAVADIAETRDGFEALLKRIKGEYPDATHHCWAFRIGIHNTVELSSDDGEPSGSAGLPILRVLAGQALLNIGCIVTRYFGGTKLGVGGLMRAYSQAASAAIRSAGITNKPLTERYRIILSYKLFPHFERAIIGSGGKILDTRYGDEIEAIYEVPLQKADELAEHLANISHGTIVLEKQ